MELTGSRDRWVLIGDDCWEAAAAGCTELFPATPIVSRRLNPSKCLVLWQCGVMVGAKARARSALPQLSAFPFASTHQSTHPPTRPPICHLPTPPSIHPPFHPSILLLPSGSNSSPLSSLLICHVPGTTPGPSILAHSLVMETAPPLRRYVLSCVLGTKQGIQGWD